MQSATAARTKGKRRWWIAIGAVALLVVAGLVVVPIMLGRLSDRRTAAQAQAGDIVVAFLGDLSDTATASGQIESAQVTRLSVGAPGLVERVDVQVGDVVADGDVLVQLETGGPALRVERAQQGLALSEANLEALLSDPRAEDVTAAEAAVLSAQVRLDNMLAGPSEQDIAESEASVRAQEANLASASAAHRSTLNSIRDSAIAAAEIDLISAQIAYDNAKTASEDDPNRDTYAAFEDAADSLAVAQTAMDELLAGPSQGTLRSAAASVSAAEANLDQAKANHELLLSGPSESQIAAAVAGLAQAEANLASLNAGASAEAIAVAEAQVDQSRLALADVQEALAEATITAPFDGLVTAVFVAKGERAAGDVVELVSSDLNVILNVDEVDIGELAVGQPAIITMETWPDVRIAAEIASIAPIADVGGDGVVSFDVRLSLEDTDLPVLIGMTANAQLITADRENVLLVPNAAITADREAGTYTVNMVTGETNGSPIVEEVQVTIGLRDGDFSEITRGLAEGDSVAIGELKAPTMQFGPFGGS